MVALVAMCGSATVTTAVPATTTTTTTTTAAGGRCGIATARMLQPARGRQRPGGAEAGGGRGAAGADAEAAGGGALRRQRDPRLLPRRCHDADLQKQWNTLHYRSPYRL